MKLLLILLHCKFYCGSIASCQCVSIPTLRISGVVGVSLAQNVTIDPVGAVTVVEGTILDITCTDGVNLGSGVFLLENNVELRGDSVPPNDVNGMMRTYRLPVNRSQNGKTYHCQSLLTAQVSPVITLSVRCK